MVRSAGARSEVPRRVEPVPYAQGRPGALEDDRILPERDPAIEPRQWRLDPMLRIGVCLTMFCAAYLAEVFRGGLQAVTRGQYEAAHTLSLSKWQTLTRIVLPQALRITIAPTTSLFIGAVKDTSLVAIVNIYDLTGTLKLAMGDADWRPYFVEMYVMVSVIYLAIGLSIAQYGRYLERRYALK